MRCSLFCLSLTVVISAASCKQDRPPIERTKMESIILDVQTAEIYSTIAGKDSTQDFLVKNEDSLATYYASIFRHYGITAAEFKGAINWYRSHPSELDSIYVHLLPRVDKNGPLRR